MKTFQTIIDENGENNVFPEIDGLDGDFINAVELWFSLREVCSNNNFIQFFQRVLYRDFGQYLQLLRIEPNIAEYDWLVQQYNEAMTETTGTASGTVTGTNTNTQTNNLANGQTTTNNLANTQTRTASGTNDTTVTNNLSDSGTRTENVAHGHAITTTRSGTNTASGSDTTATENASDTKTLQKDNPMSISYSSLSIDGTDGATAGALDWQYPTGQGETATQDDGTTTQTYGRVDSSTDTATTTNSGSDQTTTTDLESHTGTVVTDNDTTTNETVQGTNTGTVTISGTNTGTIANSGSTSQTRSDSTTDIVKHIDTGRSIDVATLLQNATSFIINSSAFEWMRKRLEPCFMGIYADDEEIEEGVFYYGEQ